MTVPESQLEREDITPTATPVANKAIEGLSPTQLAMRRFRRDKLSMVSFVIVAFYLLAALAAPILVKTGVLDPYTLHQDLLNVNLGSVPTGPFSGASAHHILGVEPGTGRDALARLWYGITFSIAIALAASIVTLTVGTVLGIISGFTGGWTDATIGRAIDLTLSFPQTLMLLALSATGVALFASFLPGTQADALPNAVYEVLVLGLFGWPPVARLVRGQVLTIREREFMEAARLLGASRSRLYFKEILPNIWAPVLVTFTLTMPLYVSAEAALSYLGVGIHPPTPTLGNVLTDSTNYATADFTYFIFPAALIAIIVVSFNLLGDGVRDALDPKGDR